MPFFVDPLCSGSTSGFGPDSRGSNPCGSTIFVLNTNMERQTVTIDGQEIEAVKVDEEWIRQKYDEFRSTYFSNWVMPSSDKISFQVGSKMLKTFGMFKYRFPNGTLKRVYPEEAPVATPSEFISRRIKSRVWFGKGEPVRLVIRLKTSDFMPEAIYENVLIHEMTHVVVKFNMMWSGEAHDGWFKKIAEYIRNASSGKYVVERHVPEQDLKIVLQIREQSGVLPNGYVVGASYYEPVRYNGARINCILFWVDSLADALKFNRLYNENNGVGFLFSDPETGQCFNETPSQCLIMKADPKNVQELKKKDWVRQLKNRLVKWDPSHPSANYIYSKSLESTKWVTDRIKNFKTHGVLVKLRSFNESFDEEGLGNFNLIYEGFFGNVVNKVKEFVGKVGPMLSRMFHYVNDSLFGDEYFDESDGTWTIP